MAAIRVPAWTVGVGRVIASDPWARVVVPVGLAVPLVSAGAVAVTGRDSSALFGVIGLPSGVLAAWMAQRGCWDLNRADRARVWDANLSGRSSGDPHLDAIAAWQLEQAARSQTADAVVVALMVLAAAVAPVAAAIRSGNLWWLLALVASATTAAFFAPLLIGEPFADRLRRLQGAVLTSRPEGRPAGRRKRRTGR